MVESRPRDVGVEHPAGIGYLSELLRRTYAAWRRDRVMRLGAGIAYYGLFALVPTLAILIALAGLAFSQQSVEAAVVDSIAETLDVEREVVSDAVSDALVILRPTSGLGLIGLGSLLLAASLLFVALQDALDVIWHTPVGTGIEYTLRRRATAFLVIVSMAALLIALVALQSVAGLLAAALPDDRTLVGALARTIATVAAWTLVAATIAVALRVLPRTDVSWRAAIIGALVTSVVLSVGNAAFGVYLRTVGVRSAEGAATTVLVVLVWFYAVSQIVLAGAVLTRQLDHHPPARAAEDAAAD